MKGMVCLRVFVLLNAVLPVFANAQMNEALPDYLEQGRALFTQPGSCITCHGPEAQGLIGPPLTAGPTPYDIAYQLQSNPQMAAIAEVLKPDEDKLIALSVYIYDLVGKDVEELKIDNLRTQLRSLSRFEVATEVVRTERDQLVDSIAPFATVLEDWQRRAKPGPLKRQYDVKVVETYEPGEPRFTPEAGKVYWYENVGTVSKDVSDTSLPIRSSQIVVGDAATKEIIASQVMPRELNGQIHTTALSPDGSTVYITGPSAKNRNNPIEIASPATLLTADALTLQPVKQLVIGARLHHAQVFQDRYMLMDTFARDPDGLDVFLFDPQTDEIVGGIVAEDLGGASYTAFTDHEFIYLLMEPLGYGPPAFSGYFGAGKVRKGELEMMRPFWVAKIDPQTWEVLREYPYPGRRGDWIVLDARSEFMYVTAGGSSTVTKINLQTGEIAWTAPTGPGPYGASLTADEKEIWTADKGETTGAFGRTLSVLDAETGAFRATLFNTYAVDHVLLAPNGTEFWSSSNRDGLITVFDAATREMTHEIEMPGRGDAHGLVWVYYPDADSGRVVRDQGGFHHGVHPAKGRPLDY